ncbi:MAG: 7TM-DISM domain-containing protein, partial [Desulfobacteraceae bacterium]|nr:7TM-DISM domain-containing protein [Desulfobacteraceae bacterium]
MNGRLGTMLRLIKKADSLLIIMTTCLALCLCLMFASCSDHQTVKREPPQAVNGLLDLSDWDFQKDGVVKLDGEWEFYWEKLLKPDDFNSPALPQKTGLIRLPSVWNNYEVNEKTLSGNGYATYRLKIKIRSSSDMKALKLHIIPTAYTLWLNNEKLLSNGVVGTSKETMTPFWSPKIASFQSTDKTIQIIVQVSNFMFRRGGIRESIIIGTEKQIRKKREKALFLEQLLLGGLIIMGLYHFGLFVFRRKDPSALYFGIVCIIIAIRVTTTGCHLLNTYVGITWEMTLKLEYLSFYLVVPFFLLFLKSLYPRELSRIIVQSSILIAIIFSMIVLFTKAPVHSHTTTTYQMITLFYIFYSLSALCLAAYKKREGAKLFLLGWLVLIVTVINDILYSQMIIFTGDIAPFGFFVFIFFQSYLLSVRFSNAFVLSEKLSKEMEEMVLHLEEKVDKRTEKLKSAYETIKKISIEDALTGCYNRRHLEDQLPREALRE